MLVRKMNLAARNTVSFSIHRSLVVTPHQTSASKLPCARILDWHLENAGLGYDGPSRMAGKCRTWKTVFVPFEFHITHM